MKNILIQLPTFISGLFNSTHSIYFFFWLVLGLFLLMFELGHPGLFLFLSFCAGSIAAALAGLNGLSFVAQCKFFLIGTISAFFGLRRWLAREQRHGYRSNIYALQGKEGVVLSAIVVTECGQVKVEGQIWRAQSMNHDAIPIDARVRVMAVKGTRLIVEKV